MKATVVDLRYKMNEILKALDRREKVTLLYHGKVKGEIIPAGEQQGVSVESHPFFNMADHKSEAVDQQMNALRGTRFNDL